MTNSFYRLTLLFVLFAAAANLPAHAELRFVDHWPKETNVCVDTPLRLTFNEAPFLRHGGRVEIVRSSDGKVADSIELGRGPEPTRFGATGGFLLWFDPIRISGNTIEIRPHWRSLSYGEAYSVRIAASDFTDGEGRPANVAPEPWTFQIKPTLPRNPSSLTVATDGSGDFCTVQGAVDQIEPYRTEKAVIMIRRGEYHELVRIGRERQHIHLIGEDRAASIICAVNNEKLNPGWNQRAVLGIEGDDSVIENLTVQNLTPYKGSQAEAIYINADRCIFRHANFLSLQDTLNLNGRVYVTHCYIEGDVDYVWGYGSALFEQCELKTMHDGYIVQARNPAGRAGYLFLDCRLTAAPEAKKVWLARIETARFPASHVSFIHCQMGPHLLPAGWQVADPASPELRFEEQDSTDLNGRPLDLSQRDSAGRPIAATQEAAEEASFLRGSDEWNPRAEEEKRNPSF